MFFIKKYNATYIVVTLLLAIYFSFFINIPIYAELSNIFDKLPHVKIGFIISIPLFFIATFNFLFNIFSWPWLTKPFFILLLIVSAGLSYAGFNYGTLFDADMLTNIVETDSAEASAYVSLYSIGWLVLFGGLPALLLSMVKFKPINSYYKFFATKIISMICSLGVIGIIAALYYQDYASVGRNNSYLRQVIIPTQFIYSVGKYVNRTYLTEPIVYKEQGLDATQSDKAIASANNKPTLMVFVLGETARAQNYQANGYPRATNDYTKDLGFISFQDVSACGTSTAISIPCMFSNLTRDSYEKKIAENQDNVLDVLKRANVDMLWLENDGGDKGVANHIRKINIDRTRKDAVCNGKTCYDSAMLENFNENVDSMKGNRILFMHLIGSHGPTYFQRYPRDKAAFQPDCPRADIENCSLEQLVNTYDNTILYSDYIMAETVNKLKELEKDYNVALFYISDHGESLGENGLFLHGMPYALAPKEQTQVPMMIWTSQGFDAEKNIDKECLMAQAKNGSFSHDNLFHSLLGIMDVSSSVYNAQLDVFASCRNK